MKKLFNILFCGIFLMLIEHIILFICIQFENILRYNIQATSIKGALRDSNEITAARFVFYFTFWVIFTYFFYGKIDSKYSLLKLAIVNCLLYVSLSLIITLFFPFTIDFFGQTFFFYLIIATFISPFILSIIPYGDRFLKVFVYNRTKSDNLNL